MAKVKVIGIIYNARVPEAQHITSALLERLNLGDRAWACPADDVDSAWPRAGETELIITVGGDGTILRAVRLAAPYGIPLLGINLGRLGFMTELRAEEALEKVPTYLEGAAWVDERAMIQAEVLSEARRVQGGEGEPAPFHALNDVVVGRGAVSRLVRITMVIDGATLASYRVDALIVSTATGSTGYNLAAGGPILHPQSGEIIVKPVAAHLGLATALLLPPSSHIELVAESDSQCMVSVDGQVDLALAAQDCVRIQRSPYMARFLRVNPPTYFYATLLQRLGLGWGREGYRAIY